MSSKEYCYDERHDAPCPLPCKACEDECQLAENRLIPEEFRQIYGPIKAMSTNGRNYVCAALTKKQYIWFDHKNNRYVVERR